MSLLMLRRNGNTFTLSIRNELSSQLAGAGKRAFSLKAGGFWSMQSQASRLSAS